MKTLILALFSLPFFASAHAAEIKGCPNGDKAIGQVFTSPGSYAHDGSNDNMRPAQWMLQCKDKAGTVYLWAK